MLKNILEEYKVAKRDLEVVIETTPNPTRAHSRKLRAQDDMPNIILRYKQKLGPSIINMVVVGSEAEKFTKIAEEDFETASVSPEALSSYIVSMLPKEYIDSIMNKPAGHSLFEIISANIYEVLADIDVQLNFQPSYKSGTHSVPINSVKDLHDYVSKILAVDFGLDMLYFYNLHQAALKALDSDFDGTGKFGLIYFTNNENLSRGVVENLKKHSSNTFLITAGEVSPELESISDVVVKAAKKTKKSKKDVDTEENLEENELSHNEITKENVKQALLAIKKLLK